MTRFSVVLFVIPVLLTPTDTFVHADDWTHWRGPSRNGIVAESSQWNGKNWLSEKEVWSRALGVGCTSPIVVDGRLYTLGWRGGKDFLYCLDAASGKEIWKTSSKCPQYGRKSLGDKGIYAGPCSTPEYDERTGYLYTLSIDGDLQAVSTKAEGRRVWGFNLYERYDSQQRPRVGRSGHRDYGFTGSPLLHGDWLIVEVGSVEGDLMAFDKKTGKRVWTSQNKSPAGHTGGPVPITVENVPCVAVLNHKGLLVARIDRGREGETVAEYEWTTSFSNNIATPAVHKNNVIVTSAYNRYTICKLEITLKGARKVWEQPQASKVCSPLVYDGHVYWAWRKLYCLDLETGKQKWAGGNFGDPGSCIVTADGRILVLAKRGDLVLAETADRSSDAYKVLAAKKGIFNTDAWPHVVLSNGRVYCKDRAGNLKCFAVGKK